MAGTPPLAAMLLMALTAVLDLQVRATDQRHHDRRMQAWDSTVAGRCAGGTAEGGVAAIRNDAHQTTGLALAINRVETVMLTLFSSNLRTSISRGTVDLNEMTDIHRSMHAQGKHWENNGIDFITAFSLSNAKGLYVGHYFPMDNYHIFYRAPDPQTIYNNADTRWYGSLFNRNTVTRGCDSSPTCSVAVGRIPEEGTSCSDPSRKCDWPTFDQCNTDHCNKTNCCLDASVTFEYSKPRDYSKGADDGRPGDLTYQGQYDPRARSWYTGTIDKWAATGKTESFSDMYVSAVASNLALSATLIIPGYGGADGQDATAGIWVGDWFPGTDFSGSPEQLVLSVDGATVRITISLDLSDIGSAIAAINAGLDGAATASQTEKGQIQLQSASVGAASSVRVDPTSGPNVKAKIFGLGGDVIGDVSFGAPYAPDNRFIDGRDAMAGTFIGERVPHRDKALSRQSQPSDWTGWDFSEHGNLGPHTLVIVVDGNSFDITLDVDLTDPMTAVAVLNDGLRGAATVTLNEDENFVIQSLTYGGGSSVSVDKESSSQKARFMVTPPAGVLLEAEQSLGGLSSDLRRLFSDPDDAIIFGRERQTGLLTVVSINEGVAYPNNTRKCASGATNALIRAAAQLLDNLGEREYVQLQVSQSKFRVSSKIFTKCLVAFCLLKLYMFVR